MESILETVKSHIPMYVEESDDFDNDIIDLINTSFSRLGSLGVKPAAFFIEDSNAEWEDYIPDDPYLLNLVKTFIKLKTKLMFDPPATSPLLDAINKNISELEFLINDHCDYNKDLYLEKQEG